MGRHIASVSFGKDSTQMLLQLIESGAPLDEVMFFDTGMEYKAIYDTRDIILPLLSDHNIKYTELHPEYDFEWMMLEKPVNSTKNGFHYGYSWCGGRCRWGTTYKIRALDKHAETQNATVYIGIAADEVKRIKKSRKPYKRLPLVTWGITESKSLQYCYEKDIIWSEDGVRLYDVLDRVSCWCCANKNLKELKNIYTYLPQYWERLKNLQRQIERPFKGPGKSIFDLEKKFMNET